MRRFIQGALVGVLLLALASLAAAQQAPQPVVRLGNWIEVGNDLFMHIIASVDIRYMTAHNLDFESRIRDQAQARNPASTSQHDTEGTCYMPHCALGQIFGTRKT